MKNFSLILSTVAIIIASVALIAVKKDKGGINETVLSETLLNNPKMVVDALQAYQDKQREEQERAAAEAVAKYTSEINNASSVPFVGPDDASVTVVEFFDFSCGYCKRLADAMEKLVESNTDVRFVFKPLSFVTPVSKYQAAAGLAVHKQGKFVEFYKAVMAFDGRMTEANVDDAAKAAGVDYDKYKEDVQSTDVSTALKEVSELAQKIQVNGVPAVFVNGKPVYARDVNELQAAINDAK